MDSRNYSVQTQGIIQKAYVNAEKLNHRTVETGHILKALINSNDSIVNDLLGKMGKNSSDIDYHLDNMMMEYPKSLGDDLYLSLDANKALRNASEFAKEMDNDLG